jgi:hypothetical protein
MHTLFGDRVYRQLQKHWHHEINQSPEGYHGRDNEENFP